MGYVTNVITSEEKQNLSNDFRREWGADVPEEELARRKAQWVLPQRQEEKGLLGRYGRMVGTAREGAVYK